MNQHSTTHASKELSEMENDIMKMSTNEKDSSLQEKSLFASYNKSSIYTMDSTTKPRSVLVSQHSCESKNLSMTSEKIHRQISRSFASLSVSKKTTVSFLLFQPPKRMFSAKKSTFH